MIKFRIAYLIVSMHRANMMPYVNAMNGSVHSLYISISHALDVDYIPLPVE